MASLADKIDGYCNPQNSMPYIEDTEDAQIRALKSHGVQPGIHFLKQESLSDQHPTLRRDDAGDIQLQVIKALRAQREDR